MYYLYYSHSGASLRKTSLPGRLVTPWTLVKSARHRSVRTPRVGFAPVTSPPPRLFHAHARVRSRRPI
jgi:hypothetical protein